MKEELYEWDSRSLPDKRKYPSENFFEPNSITRSRDKEEAREILEGESIVVLGDADADGLAAKACIDAYYDESVPFVPCGPHGGGVYLGEAIQMAIYGLEEDSTVYIQDVTVDEQWKIKHLPRLQEKAEILWFDHHEWDSDVESFARNNTDYFEVDTGKDFPEENQFAARCTAMMIRDYFSNKENHQFSQKLNELVDVTGEYDLWRLRDERCYDLNDYSQVVESHENYISTVREFGAEIMKIDSVNQSVSEFREEQRKLHDRAISTAEIKIVNGIKVAEIYGNCQVNEVAETLRKNESVDLCVFSKPHGGISLRGSTGFTDCDSIAQEMGGGGHEKAAGAFADEFDSIGDYVSHWSSEGKSVFSKVREKIKRI